MKKLIYILSALFILTSCESFLDTELLTDKTTENFPETEKNVDVYLCKVIV